MGREDNILILILAFLLMMAVPAIAGADPGLLSTGTNTYEEPSFFVTHGGDSAQDYEFYISLGQPNLATEYSRPQRSLAGLTVLAMMGAGGWAGNTVARDSWDFLSTSLAVGIGAFAVGLPAGLIMASLAFGEREPVYADRQRELAASEDSEFNRELDISRTIDESAPQEPIMIRVLQLNF